MSNPKPRTIRIFLPSGDPQGIRVAEVTTGIVRVIDVPQKLLDSYLAMPEAKQGGVYFLIGDDQDEDLAPMYIGHTGATGKRLVEHKEKKDYWSRALIAVVRTDEMTTTHTAYLEWLGIKIARECERYVVQNKNGGCKPTTPQPLEADCREIFDVLRTLVATLGQPMFEPSTKPNDPGAKNEFFFCKSAQSHYDATGLHTSEGMWVLKGSRAKQEIAPSMTKVKRRDALIAEGTLVLVDGYYVFQKDVLFKTPSGASDTVCGASTNGWVLWKSKDGTTLDELKRAVPSSSPVGLES